MSSTTGLQIMTEHLPAGQPIVRLAEPHDEDAIIAILRDGVHGDCGIRRGDGTPLAFVEEKTRRNIRHAIGDRNTSFLGVVGHSDVVEGAVLLHLRDQFYTDDLVLSEGWFFVSPRYRKSNNAKMLIAFSKALAASLKVPLVMGVISAERQAAKMRFLERQMGSQNVGRYYVFNYDQVGGNANV